MLQKFGCDEMLSLKIPPVAEAFAHHAVMVIAIASIERNPSNHERRHIRCDAAAVYFGNIFGVTDSVSLQ